MHNANQPPRREPPLGQALVPVALLIGLLGSSVYLFGDGVVVWSKPDCAHPLHRRRERDRARQRTPVEGPRGGNQPRDFRVDGRDPSSYWLSGR